MKKKRKKNISAVLAFFLQPPTQNHCEDTSLTAEAAASPRGEKPALNLCKGSTLTSCDFDQWMLLRRCDSFDLYGCWEFSATVQTTVWFSAAFCSPVPVYFDVRVAHRGPLGIKLQFRIKLSKRRLPSSLVHDGCQTLIFVFLFSVGRPRRYLFLLYWKVILQAKQANFHIHTN